MMVYYHFKESLQKDQYLFKEEDTPKVTLKVKYLYKEGILKIFYLVMGYLFKDYQYTEHSPKVLWRPPFTTRWRPSLSRMCPSACR